MVTSSFNWCVIDIFSQISFISLFLFVYMLDRWLFKMCLTFYLFFARSLWTLSFFSQFIYSLYLKILVPLGAVIYFLLKGDQQ